jgi:hypothetical protein
MARKYARDNRGRFAAKGTGATARGGRLKTASGNKRETQKISALSGDRMSSVPKGAIGKTRKQREITMIDRAQDKRVAYNQGRAKQQAAIAARKAAPQAPAAGSFAANKIEMAKGRVSVLTKQKNSLNKQLKEVNAQIKEAGPSGGAYRLKKIEIKSRLSETQVALSQAKAASRPDMAVVNIPMSGRRGRALDASITRAVKEVRASQMAALMKPKAQVRAERAASAEAKRQAAAAKPQLVRSAQSLRMSRAKQVQKRRSMNISNPAGWRQESAGRMAANAARTQERALAFYKKKRK